MHFPEQQLTTYLRAFNPEERIDALLDEVAQAAIDQEVEETVQLYVLAHGVMEPDQRRTDDLEAVVLVEEVGLDVDEVAVVLDVNRSAVEAAVARAWAEVAESDAAADERSEAATDVQQPAGRPSEPPSAAPADAGPAAELSAPARSRYVGPGPDRRDEVARRPSRRAVATAVVVVGLVVLAVAAFSEAGQQRLAAQGLNPFGAVGALVGLLGVGGLLVVLGRDDRS